MLKDFRAFLMRGNVVDLAVAVVIGAAFGAIVTSFVKDILMPPIGLVLGRVNFDDLFVTLSGASYPSLAAAKAAGAPTLNYGAFINTIINFVIVGSAVFLLVRVIDRLHARPLPPSPSTKECPQCAMVIPVRAVRCPHCTSNVGGPRDGPPHPPTLVASRRSRDAPRFRYSGASAARRSRYACHSTGRSDFLRELQSLHAATTLPRAEVPPRPSGTR